MSIFHHPKLRDCNLITLAWLGNMKWRCGTRSFSYAFPPPRLVIVCQVIMWLHHVTCRNGVFNSEICDVLHLSPDHVIKSHTISTLCTISSFSKNLVHLLYPFGNIGGYNKTLILQSETVITKWDRQQLSKIYYKYDRSLTHSASGIKKFDKLSLQIVAGITKCDRLLLQSASDITNCNSYYKVRRNNGIP